MKLDSRIRQRIRKYGELLVVGLVSAGTIIVSKSIVRNQRHVHVAASMALSGSI